MEAECRRTCIRPRRRQACTDRRRLLHQERQGRDRLERRHLQGRRRVLKRRSRVRIEKTLQEDVALAMVARALVALRERLRP